MGRFFSTASLFAGFAGAAAPPSELWPQPDFASSTGLTLTAFDGAPPTVHDGVLDFGDGSQDGEATGTSLGTLVALATYRITARSANGAGPYNVSVSTGSVPGEVGFSGDTTSDETHDVTILTLGTQDIDIVNNYVGQQLTSLSVTRIA